MSIFPVHFRIIFGSFSHHLRIACPCRLAGQRPQRIVAHAFVDEVAQSLDILVCADEISSSR